MLARDYVRFGIVGVLGFIVNLTILTILFKLAGLPLFLSQFIAAEIALFGNFILHHKWTYNSRNVKKSLKNIVLQFHLTSWVAILGSALLVTLIVKSLNVHYFIALSISSAIAMIWNYLWTKMVVWKDKTEEQLNGGYTKK